MQYKGIIIPAQCNVVVKWNPANADTVGITTACLEYGGICNSEATSAPPVDVVMCSRAVEHEEVAFSDPSVAIQCLERLVR